MGTSLLDPSSAIDTLLGALVPPPQVTPSGPPQLPPPQAAPLPQQSPATTASLLNGGNAPSGPMGQPGVFHRVISNLLGIPGHISDAVRPGVPAAYQSLLAAGLISPDEAQAARPSLLHSLIGGPNAPSSSEQYANNLNQVLGAHQTITQIGEARRQLQARHDMAQLFPQPQPTGDPIKDHDNMANWLAGQFGYATSHNLPDIAKDMESALRGVMSVPPTPKDQIIPQGSTVMRNGQPVFTAPFAPKDLPPQPFVSKNGNSTIWVKPGDPVPAGYRSAAQERTEVTVQGANERAAMRPAGGGGATGLGSGGIGGVARQAAAITGLNNADARMQPFENMVKSGTANYTGLDYWQGLRAKMYDAKGIKDEAIHADLYAKLNQDNPELANYLQSAEQWALEDSQLSNRPSDFRTKMDAFVSAIGPRAGGKMIGNVQSFRSTRLATLNRARVAMEAIMDRVAGPAAAKAASDLPPMSSATPIPAGGRTVTVKGKTYKIPD